jgi:uncharacterized protein (DUF433 family)
MDIESYFERVADDEILIRGTRVDLATVLDAYREGLSPEEIAYNYPTLTLEQVYASVTYYLAHREALDGASGEACSAAGDARRARSEAPSRASRCAR